MSDDKKPTNPPQGEPHKSNSDNNKEQKPLPSFRQLEREIRRKIDVNRGGAKPQRKQRG